MAQVLYRKWRPATWDQVVGQSHVIQTLRNAVARDHLAHAYLFSGPRGTGKTTTARLLAKAANCLADDPAERPDNSCEHCLAINQSRFLDLIEIDAASNTSVDDVRDLRERINFAPNVGRFKVYIVDEVHMLSTAAFNALLKTLEEPPGHAIFVLATTEVQKIPPTVLSRCQRHEFRRLPVPEMSAYLAQMIEQEQFAVEPEALELIARQATGSLRDAVSLLDQLVSIGEQVTLEQARQVLGVAGYAVVGQLVTKLAEGQIGEGLHLIQQALDGGVDARQLARQLVAYLRGVLLTQLGQDDLPEFGSEQRAEMAELARQMSREQLLRAMRAFSQASQSRPGSWQPGLELELALVEAGEPAFSSAGEEKQSSDGPRSQPKKAVEPGPPPANTAQDDEPAGAPPDEEPPKTIGQGEPSEAKVEGETAEPDMDKGSAQADAGGESAELEVAEGSAEADQPAFERLMAVWPQLLAAAYKRNPQTQALLNSCKPLGLERGALMLGFQSDLLREKMEKGRNLETVIDSLQEVLGQDLQLRCVLLKDWDRDLKRVSAPPPMQEGGMVATALRELGAEIVDYREEDE